MSRNERKPSGTLEEQLRRIAKHFAPEGNQGEIYSVRFESILDELKASNLIDDWKATVQYSQDDVGGIDYLLTQKGRQVPLSSTSTRRHALQRKAKHPDIPVIYLRRRDGPGLESEERIKRLILQKAK